MNNGPEGTPTGVPFFVQNSGVPIPVAHLPEL